MRELIRGAYEKATSILKDNEEKLHELAAYLLERETITGEQFMAILDKKPDVEDTAEPLPQPKVSLSKDDDNTEEA